MSEPPEEQASIPEPALTDLLKTQTEILARLSTLEGQSKGSGSADRLSLFVFSGVHDRILAAFMLASTAAASGVEVQMFFTFWALGALRDAKKSVKKDLLSRMFGWMIPRGARKMPLSQMNMLGAGVPMLHLIMKQRKVPTLDEMMAVCGECGVQILVCEMSRQVMGIQMEELVDYPHMKFSGLAAFLDRAADGRVTMFV